MIHRTDIPASATRYYRPHAWAYGIAMLLAAVLALISSAIWVFWPLMVWTILFLIHFLVVRSLDVDSDWVAERTDKTAKKAFDISHIETIRESYEKSASRFQRNDADESKDESDAATKLEKTSEKRP